MDMAVAVTVLVKDAEVGIAERGDDHEARQQDTLGSLGHPPRGQREEERAESHEAHDPADGDHLVCRHRAAPPKRVVSSVRRQSLWRADPWPERCLAPGEGR